jgi:hypothetical protein
MYQNDYEDIKEVLLNSIKDPVVIEELLKRYKGKERLLADLLEQSIEEIAEASNPWRYKPVTPREFLKDPYYCGINPNTGEGVCETIYPILEDAFAEIHDLNSEIREVILTGGIGWGKSFMMELGLLWHIYILSCLKNPQRYFSLSPASKISVMVISITEKQAKKNIYSAVKDMVDKIEYFQENFMYDKKRSADSLIFPRNIEFFNGTSAQSSAIGLNIFSASLDEANFFKKVTNSKRANESRGVFDEALTLYYSLLRRQESRFLKKGVKPGLLYIGSSKIFPNDFTAQRIKAALDSEAQGAKKTTFVMDYNVWKVNREKYSEEEFMVEVGGINRRSRILDGFETDIVGEVIKVPMDFIDKFKKDIDNSLRDIAGIGVHNISPFIGNKEAIKNMFSENDSRIFSLDTATLSPKSEYLLLEKITKSCTEYPERPRYVAIDIGLKKDALGFAMAYIEDYCYIEKEYFDEEEQKLKIIKQKMPKIKIEMVLRVVPEKEFGEVELARVRWLIFQLKRKGYRVRYSSGDGFQSADMQQILKRNGINFDYVSLDRTTEPYETFRSAIYENRVNCVYHEFLEKELNELERNYQLDKVDHPPTGSKDVADAVASLVYNIHVRPSFNDLSLLPISSLAKNQGNDMVEFEGDEYQKIINEFEKWAKK